MKRVAKFKVAPNGESVIHTVYLDGALQISQSLSQTNAEKMQADLIRNGWTRSVEGGNIVFCFNV